MEVKIGVLHTPRELVLDSAQTADEVSAAVAAAIADGSVLSLVDERGRTVMVPSDRVAYVEISPASARRVGFGTPA